MRRRHAAALTTLIALASAVGLDVPAASASVPAPRLAYVTGGATSLTQVWLATRGRDRGHRLGPGEQPLLSPDGAVVAASAVRRHGAALTLYRAGGGVIRRFFDAGVATAAAQAWSPDSRYLAVTLTSRDPAGDAG